jgi:hypothetical protein
MGMGYVIINTFSGTGIFRKADKRAIQHKG